MKTSAFILCVFAALAVGCSQKKSSENVSDKKDITFNECYRSVFDKDSATLKLSQENGKVSGKLHMMFSKKEHMQGDLSGNFQGDTLFADYTYTMGKGKEIFKNPMAFLKKNGKLYQGYGEIVTQYGRTFFNKEVPIDFSRGFVFEIVECKLE